jgi:Xaa-Pro aminopeptidase
VDGEILHNHAYKNQLKDGDLLLLDGGAESPFGYATDVTRTWPVSGRFSSKQQRAYEAVLKSQEQAIDMVRPGVRYRDIHMAASLSLSEFLVDEKLLLGNPKDLVIQGAHALFFPHGIGHLLGLDVHDMENFGDKAAYTKGRHRSPQFGTGYLRMDMDLEPNMVVTIEPGFYICPAIFADATLYSTFKNVVNWDVLENWKGFGGIRIEDDIRCTTEDPENITAMIPKQIDEITSLVGSLTE